MKTASTQYIVDAKGHKKGVYLSIRQYEKMMADLHDLSVIAERKDETTISLSQLKANLKKGL
jgi:hypothetical protein